MLRILLIAVLVYFLFKWILGMFKTGRTGAAGKSGDDPQANKDYYGSITDQEIEDVDFEEVDKEKEE